MDSEYLESVKQGKDEYFTLSRKTSFKQKTLSSNNQEVAVRNIERITFKAKRESGLESFLKSVHPQIEQNKDFKQARRK